MSDLQLSLLAIGGLVIVVVYAYNVYQERRLRRRLEQAFGAERDDVLLEVESAKRIEPQLNPGPEWDDDPQPVASLHVSPEPEPEPEPEHEPAAASVTEPAPPLPAVPGFDDELDYVVSIDAADPVPEAAFADLFIRGGTFGKSLRVAGYNPVEGQWEEASRTAVGHYSRLRVALQLLDRHGALAAVQLATFCDAIHGWAAGIPATCSFPDQQEALARAHDLDRFCAEVDIAIGLNVVAKEGQSFPGGRIRTLAEGEGFRLESDGLFHFRDEHRRTLFTLDNHEPAPFIPEQIRSLTTSGVTLLLDVPRIADGAPVLDRMVQIAQQLARALNGRLVDDNRSLLTETGIAAIRRQLEAISEKMQARGFAAGSERALRLFS